MRVWLASLSLVLVSCGGGGAPGTPAPEVPPAPVEGLRYYVDYEGPTGVYYGTDPLPPAQAAVSPHVEIEFRDDFPVRVREVGPGGRLEREISIDRRARRVLTSTRDRFGRLEESRACELDSSGASPVLRCQGVQGSQQAVFLGCASWIEAFDADRHLTRATCLDERGNVTRSAQGWASWEFAYDEAGRERERRALDAAGALVVTEPGFAIARQEFRPDGRLRASRYFDATGAPAVGADGVHELRLTYEAEVCAALPDPAPCLAAARDYVLLESYFTARGEPVAAKNGGFALRTERDQAGDLSRWTLLGADGRPLPAAPQFCPAYTMRYDERRLLTQKSCVDGAATPVNVDGVHRTDYRYDEFGRRIEARYFDAAGNAARLGLCYGEGSVYDEFDRVVGETCLDHTGALYQPTGYYCKLRYTYDTQGFMSRKDDLSCDDKPSNERAGIFSTKYERDRAGRITSLTYLDAAGTPMIAAFGYSEERLRYDERGRQSEQSFWHNGAPIEAVRLCFNGKMCTGSDGVPLSYHKMVFHYTDAGELLSLDFVSAAGAPLGGRDCKTQYCP